MPKESEEEGYTVVDKRQRSGASEPAEPTPPRPSQDRSEPSGSAPASAFATPPEPDLSALFLMLASSALVHLARAPDPETGAAERDLAQARLCIDWLRLLRDKTEGHRTAEESQLLEGILYDLQMQFVEAMGRASHSGS